MDTSSVQEWIQLSYAKVFYILLIGIALALLTCGLSQVHNAVQCCVLPFSIVGKGASCLFSCLYGDSCCRDSPRWRVPGEDSAV